MNENFNVLLEKSVDENQEIEINNYSRKSLMNKNLFGKFL
jgi:hypothetical protein